MIDVKIDRDQDVNAGLDALIDGGKLTGKIGWPADAFYVDKLGRTTTVAQVALDNEFGTVKRAPEGFRMVTIPARPFLRNTIRKHSQDWSNAMQQGAQAVLDNSASFDKVLLNVTNEAISDVHDTIRERVAPPLSPVTIALRADKRKAKQLPGGDLPLFDTGHLAQTLTNEVTSE